MTKQRVYCRLGAEDLRFEEGMEAPSVQTGKHSCFVEWARRCAMNGTANGTAGEHDRDVEKTRGRLLG